MSVLDPAPDFEADDSFLHAVLGGLVAAEALGSVLDAVERDVPAGAPPAEDALLYALLGLVRMRAQVTTAVKSWAEAAPLPPPPAAAESLAAPVEGILR